MTKPPQAALTTRAALLATLTEKEWQRHVTEWAHAAGYRVFHVTDSRKSAGGFPDLVLVKPGQPVIFAELKTVQGRLSPQQKIWLADLDQATGCDTYVWRPTDEKAVHAALKGIE